MTDAAQGWRGRPPTVLESLYSYVQSKEDASSGFDADGLDVRSELEQFICSELSRQADGVVAVGCGDGAAAAPACELLPSLLRPKPGPNSLKALLQRHARRRKLQEVESQLEEADLRRMVGLLEAAAIPNAADPSEPRIDYDGFAQVATECMASLGPAVGAFFQASTFLQFERDDAGAISLPLYVQYLSQHANAMQLRAQLCFYDEGTGELGGPQLERYLADVAQELPLLSSMEPWFMPHYTRIATRKLLFFHGRRRGRGGDVRVRLSDLLVSPVIMELQELRALGLSGAASDGRDLSSNWFSLQSTQRVYNTFHAWDVDGNGALSRAEFSRISQGTMTELFITRVFQEHVAAPRGGAWPPQQQQREREEGGEQDGEEGETEAETEGGGSSGGSQEGGGGSGEGGGKPRARRAAPGAAPRDEMDMMAFVDFVLAWDHRNHPAALGYFFGIFDLRRKGHLSHSDLYTFFREVHALWVAMGEYADLSTHDVLDEILDMAAPRSPGRITLQDLRQCKMAGTIFSILANVDQFYQYNYRENFMHGGEGAAGEQQQQEQQEGPEAAAAGDGGGEARRQDGQQQELEPHDIEEGGLDGVYDL